MTDIILGLGFTLMGFGSILYTYYQALPKHTNEKV